MTANTRLARPPIDFAAHEIRVLDFSRTLYPRFDDSKISCSMTTVSLHRTAPKFTIISHVPSPAEELVECLVVDGQPVSIPAGLVTALETLSEQRSFLSMSFPVHLWIEEACVDHESAEETEYLHSVIPDIYKKAAGLMCHLGSGDTRIRTFLRVARLMFRYVNRSSPGTQDLLSWRGIFTYLRRRGRSEADIPRTLAEYSELAIHFFEHPFWNRMRYLQEYLSVKTVGLIYEDIVLWDCMLLEVGMMVLQQEDEFLPQETISPSGIVTGSPRASLLKGLQSWRKLVQWELTRLFLGFHAEGNTPLAWHYLAQLAPQLHSEDDPDEENAYLQLASCMLQSGHSWPTPLKPMEKASGHGQLLQWLLSVNKLSASEATNPTSSFSVALDDLLSVSRTCLSESPLFFLSHAGMGFHDRSGDIPSWIPDYDAISGSPSRVPLTFEDPTAYTGPDYCRHNPTTQQGSLIVLGAKVGQLVEVQDIPEPTHIIDLFAFLRTLPTYEITSDPHRTGTLHRIKQILLALHRDPHHPPTGAALHRCVGTLLLSLQGTTNLPFRLLDLVPGDDMTVIVDRVRDTFLPDVDASATDAYGWAAASRAAALCLAEERIRDVRMYYALGRVEGGSWELVPRKARVGDGVFKVRGYGAGVVLRDGERGLKLVGACGVDVKGFDVWNVDLERLAIR